MLSAAWLNVLTNSKMRTLRVRAGLYGLIMAQLIKPQRALLNDN